jgi:hypothetical protein
MDGIFHPSLWKTSSTQETPLACRDRCSGEPWAGENPPSVCAKLFKMSRLEINQVPLSVGNRPDTRLHDFPLWHSAPRGRS